MYAPGWYTGEHLKLTFLCPFFGSLPLSLWCVNHPWLLAAAGTLTMLFEFSMPILLLTPQYRYFAVAAGTVFHLLILFTFNITAIFSLTMFAHYILVVPPEHWKKLFEKTRGLRVAAGMKKKIIGEPELEGAKNEGGGFFRTRRVRKTSI
jgi:hypothetical protein